MTEQQQLADAAPPSPESFGEVYKMLGSSPTYLHLMESALGEGYGAQLSGATPAEVRFLATRAGIGAGHQVVDLCCGLGGPTLLLAREYGCRVVGVDWSRQAVVYCRNTAQDAGLGDLVPVVVADVGQAPFAPESFDAVVSVDGFYFGVDLPALYRAAYQMLRPGGRFAFFFDVPAPEVVAASPPERRAHRASHRIDHLATLRQAGFVDAYAEDRTAAQQLLFSRILDSFNAHFPALAAEIGADLAAGLRDEISGLIQMKSQNLWPRYLFSARKAG